MSVWVYVRILFFHPYLPTVLCVFLKGRVRECFWYGKQKGMKQLFDEQETFQALNNLGATSACRSGGILFSVSEAVHSWGKGEQGFGLHGATA